MGQPLGINVNAGDSMGRRAIHFAAATNNYRGMEILMQFPGINIEAPSAGNETPLMRAVQFASEEAVYLLLAAGADPVSI